MNFERKTQPLNIPGSLRLLRVGGEEVGIGGGGDSGGESDGDGGKGKPEGVPLYQEREA